MGFLIKMMKGREYIVHIEEFDNIQKGVKTY